MHFNQIVYATLVILISVHLGNIFCLKSDNENKAKTDVERLVKLKELLKQQENIYKSLQNDFDGGFQIENELASNQEEPEEPAKYLDSNESDNANSDEEQDESKRSAYLRFGKRNPAYLRFGRSQAYLRFGKRSPPAYLRFGKRNPAYLRFGRSVDNVESSQNAEQAPAN